MRDIGEHCVEPEYCSNYEDKHPSFLTPLDINDSHDPEAILISACMIDNTLEGTSEKCPMIKIFIARSLQLGKADERCIKFLEGKIKLPYSPESPSDIINS